MHVLTRPVLFLDGILRKERVRFLCKPVKNNRLKIIDFAFAIKNWML